MEADDSMILGQLREAGSEGMARSKLGPSGSQRDEALRRLLMDGAVRKHQVGAQERFYLPQCAPNLESFTEHLLKALGSREPALMTRAELRELVPLEDRNLLDMALPHLESSRVLHAFRRGKATYWVFLPGLHSVARRGPVVAEFEGLNVRLLRSVYLELQRESGLASVRIRKLHQRSGQGLRALHAYLQAEFEAGRAELFEDDWSLATPSDRASVLNLNGKRFLNVRFRS